VDLQKYSKDTFKRVLGDLVKFEDYVTEVNESKQLRGGKLPARIYTIIIMEPDAMTPEDITKMKQQAQAPPPAKGGTGSVETRPKPEGQK